MTVLDEDLAQGDPGHLAAHEELAHLHNLLEALYTAGILGSSGHTANSVVGATAGTTLADIAIGASRLFGRKATGDIGPLTPAEVLTILAVYTSAQTDTAIGTAIANLVGTAPSTLNTLGEISDALNDDASAAATLTTLIGTKMASSVLNANSVLIADTDDTPIPLAMGASTILARLASGGIVAATPAQLRTLLGLVIGTDVAAFGDARFTTLPVNAQTGTTYTLAITDPGKRVTMSNASASVLTVPPNSTIAIPVESVIPVRQLGAGQVTLTPGAGVTIRSRIGLKLAGQYAGGMLEKLATDEWLATGDLTT